MGSSYESINNLELREVQRVIQVDLRPACSTFDIMTPIPESSLPNRAFRGTGRRRSQRFSGAVTGRGKPIDQQKTRDSQYSKHLIPNVCVGR